ncbi:RNA polymerase II subunit B1 CTD phosphatase RPAP2 [Sarcoptes scabiei]|nr:RNA polymerase II subunit B1 CTD phosphatase RPAP2 [Sarcoptes scabiei]
MDKKRIKSSSQNVAKKSSAQSSSSSSSSTSLRNNVSEKFNTKSKKPKSFIRDLDDDDDYQKFDGQQSDDLIPNQTDEFSIKAAVKESRLKYKKMSSLETKFFKDCNPEVYLEIRNLILCHWYNRPSIGITIDLIKNRFKIKSKNLELAENIIKFLERNCLINFGIFKINDSQRYLNASNKKKKIIIIGSGASGLAAARQLVHFGFDVLILEASKRIGGRCYSYYKNEIFFDAGNVFVSGCKSNPIRTVLKQLGLNAKRIHSRHKLYMNGEKVEKKKDLVLHNVFLQFLQFLYDLALNEEIVEINKQQLSPENIFDSFIYFLEVSTMHRTMEHFKKLLHLEENFNINLIELSNRYESFLKSLEFYHAVNPVASRTWPTNQKKSLKKSNPQNIDNDFDRNLTINDHFIDDNNSTFNLSSIIESHLAFLDCLSEKTRLELISSKIKKMNQSSEFNVCTEFFSVEDRRIFEWYFASLEYFLGAPMSDYSLKFFADDDFPHCDQQYFIPDGYMNLMQSLYSSNDSTLKILKKTQAKRVVLKETEIEVIALKSETNEIISLKCDAVICTVPLGVLKKSIDTKVTENDFSNKLIFEPPLPRRKRSAIRRLGFGTINKVIIGFDKNFWGDQDNFFGNVGLSRESRGEFPLSFFYDPSMFENRSEYQQQNLDRSSNKSKKRRKLIDENQMCSVSSIICGNCVESMKITDDNLIISKCYNGLKEIFENVPPIAAVSVTHWEREPFYMGTHSYPSIKSNFGDHDILAEPVSYSPDHLPRLFFAGEHTSKDSPATVHGAFLSGLRAATQVANRFDSLKFV